MTKGWIWDSGYRVVMVGRPSQKINRADGDKQEAIARSEGEKMKRINEAEGRGQKIERVAMATAKGIREIANAINQRGGSGAVNLRLAEHYLNEFGKLAQANNTLIISSNLSAVAAMVGTVGTIFTSTNSLKESRKE